MTSGFDSFMSQFRAGAAYLASDAERFSKDLKIHNAAMKALTTVSTQVHAERVVIRAALKAARSRIVHKERMSDPTYKELYARISAAVSSREEPASLYSFDDPVPSFDDVPCPDAAAKVLIDAKVSEMETERKAFLDEVRFALRNDPVLKDQFKLELSNMNCDRYWHGIGLNCEVIDIPR